jgi:hypothetical protein
MSSPDRLITPVELTTSSASPIYTSPANTTTVIKSAVVCETTAATILLSVWVVPSAGSVADSTKLYNAKSIGASTTVALSELNNCVLEAGDKLYAIGDVGSALTMHLSGLTV